MSEQKKIRVGIVGLGMGSTHIEKYRQHPQCEVAAICDMNTELLDFVAHEKHVGRKFANATEMFHSGAVDAVSIATPNRFHAPLSIEALKAGLHVLCEKPMAMNAGEAQEMVNTAKETGKKLGIHFNHRMMPEVQALARYIQAGDLGEIYYGRTFWHRRKGIPGLASFLDKNNSGGGAMIDLGVHMLDMTLFLMGYPEVVSVTAAACTKFDQKDVPDIPMTVDDFATAYLRLASGATLSMEISWACHHDHPEQRLVQVYGTEGGGRWLSNDYQRTDLSLSRREHGTLVTTKLDGDPPNLTSVQEDFVQAILDDREPLCSAVHGLTTMKVLDAIYQSSETGREVVL